jgi:competence protein ComEC
MLARTLAFAAGIYCLLQFSFLPTYWLFASLPCLYLLARKFAVIKILLVFALGFCWALLRIGSDVTNALNPEIENSTVLLTGIVSTLPEINNDHVRLLIKVNDIVDDKQRHIPIDGKVRLNWYKTNIIPAPGETWQLRVKLKRPYSFMNPGGFDYETWMLKQGIKATGYVKQSNLNRKLHDSDGYFIERLRYKISQKIKQSIDKPLLGLVLALSLGDRSQLVPEQWRTLTQTGTNHLIAISGLHLGLIAGFIYFLAHLFWRHFFHATQYLPAPIMASIMAFAGAAFYAALAGFALPTQRALIMLAVFLISLFSAKKIAGINVVCVAMLMILILQPLAIIAVDFWLSFSAVMLILYLTRNRKNKQGHLHQWLRLQLFLSLALCPLLIFWFKQFPLYSVLANIIAIPLIGFMLVPLVLIAMALLFTFPLLAEHLYGIIDKLNSLLWAYLETLSLQAHAVIPVAASNSAYLLLAICGALILLMPRGLPGRWIGILYLLPLLFPTVPRLNHAEYTFSLLDVGQGLAAVIQTSQHVLVYDTGARFSERFNIGDAVINPYLKAKGVKRISTLIVSHGDNDHIGGAHALLENISIDRILTSVPDKFPLPITQKCFAGQRWEWDGVEFEILHPAAGSSFTGNNASCVVKVSSKHGSVLLTGDIELRAENKLLNTAGERAKSDVMVVPHHGSRTSSSKAFIASVAPKYAFVSAGYRNRFGFPKQDIMSRYENHGIESLVSYNSGELFVKFVKTGLIIEQFRSKSRRFWHH